MNATAVSLRHLERELFRENRFLGLPHGLAAAGPAFLAMLCCLRWSLAYDNYLTWLGVGVVYAIAYGILALRLPRRQYLKALAHQRYDEELLAGCQLELCFDRLEISQQDEPLHRLFPEALDDAVARQLHVARP